MNADQEKPKPLKRGGTGAAEEKSCSGKSCGKVFNFGDFGNSGNFGNLF
jgi:hypothetical protein